MPQTLLAHQRRRLVAARKSIEHSGLAQRRSAASAAGDVFSRARPHPAAPRLEPDSHGLVWLPDDAFAAAFAQNATPAEQAVHTTAA